MALGPVWINLGAPGHGIAGWRVDGLDGELDGLPLDAPASSTAARSARASSTAARAARARPVPHPNGAIGIDHVVVLTPDFERTAGSLDQAGLGLRRVATRPDGARMGFRRLGPAILELVEAAGTGSGPARFWGFVVIVSDLDALADRLGEHLSPPRAAVQPGRRIATLRESAGLQQAVAFMDPDPAED
jgi:catechol 2,3-dioxygenase-like lactoylglutathione lyase family enzyme